MTCTMPEAKFVPIDTQKTLNYILECISEANRGLSFIEANKTLTKKLKAKLCECYDMCRDL